MQTALMGSRVPRGMVLSAMALAALALGVLVYLGDRAAGSTWLIPPGTAWHGWHGFGPAAAWLPSALHTFAFALLSAALLPPRPALQGIACIGWGTVNLAFESGQHPSVAPWLAAALESALPAALAQPLAQYFRRGTFDPADLVAVLMGGLAAWALLYWTHPEPETAHAL